MRGAMFLVLAALLGALLGCGEDRKPELSGTVKYDGKPLTSGTVWLVGEDGSKWPSGIGPKGEYAVLGVPPGKAAIYVESHSRTPKGMGGGPAFPLPKCYSNAKTSGLEVTVTGRDQKFDVIMKPVSEK
jgi:hypothetical protein